MKFVGMRPVVVHGGGKDITRLTEKLGIQSQVRGWIEGHRLADNGSCRNGSWRKDQQRTGKHNPTVGRTGRGISGKDGGLLEATRVTSKTGKDIGFVGKVSKVNTAVLDILIKNNSSQ